MNDEKILHVSDLHGDVGWLQWLIRESRNYGLVVIAGDVADLLTPHPRTEKIPELTRLLRKLRKTTKLAVVSGNHDFVPLSNGRFVGPSWIHSLRAANVWLDGDTFQFGNSTFRCFGWGSTLPEQGPGEVWVTHAPPEGAKTAAVPGGVGFGNFDLAHLCTKGAGPMLALSGHVHTPLSWHARVGRTLSLNAGQADGNAVHPNYNVIHLDRGIVTHHRYVGAVMDMTRVGEPRTCPVEES